MHQILKFHDGLQTFLLTSTGRAALLGRSAGSALWLTLLGEGYNNSKNMLFVLFWACMD